MFGKETLVWVIIASIATPENVHLPYIEGVFFNFCDAEHHLADLITDQMENPRSFRTIFHVEGPYEVK